MEIEELLKYMLSFFQEIDKQLSELSNAQSVIDKKQDEILHYIEIHKLNAVDSCKIIKVLKQVRNERRQIKNEIDIMRSVKANFVDKYKNKMIEKDIILALKNLNELRKRQENPTFKYKYLTENLEIKEVIDNDKQRKICKSY